MIHRIGSKKRRSSDFDGIRFRQGIVKISRLSHFQEILRLPPIVLQQIERGQMYHLVQKRCHVWFVVFNDPNRSGLRMVELR